MRRRACNPQCRNENICENDPVFGLIPSAGSVAITYSFDFALLPYVPADGRLEQLNSRQAISRSGTGQQSIEILERFFRLRLHEPEYSFFAHIVVSHRFDHPYQDLQRPIPAVLGNGREHIGS